MTQNDARLFFSMRVSTWPNGQPISVYVLPDDDPLHRDFATSVLQLYPYQLRRIWDRQLFSGTGQAPIVVKNELELINSVASTPGAIGYVRKAPQDNRIRVINVP